MWELEHKEGWARKNGCFLTVVFKKTLESHWDYNQSILKEINSEYSLEGLMLTSQYSGHLTWRVDSLERPWCWERLRAGEADDRGWNGMAWTWVWPKSGRLWRTGKPDVLQSMGSQWVGHDWVTEQQQIKEQSQHPTRKVDWLIFNGPKKFLSQTKG